MATNGHKWPQMTTNDHKWPQMALLKNGKDQKLIFFLNKILFFKNASNQKQFTICHQNGFDILTRSGIIGKRTVYQHFSEKWQVWNNM